MNKERYDQIVDEVYGKYLDYLLENDIHGLLYDEKTFINECKIDKEFSERWGLKIEERELSSKERITFAGFDYENKGGIGWNMIKETVDENNDIPRKLITVTYNNEKIEIYE